MFGGSMRCMCVRHENRRRVHLIPCCSRLFTGLHQMTFWKNPISASDMSCDYIPTSVGHGCDCVARDLRLVVLGVTDSTSVVVFNGLMHDHIEEKTVIVNLHPYRKFKCRFYHCPTSSCKRNKNYL